MLKLASIVLVAAALPALADAPPPASATPKTIFNYAPPPTTCYFIREANHQLQATQDKPGFMPLAGAEKAPLAASFANCTADGVVMKTAIKTVIGK
jgi:hypothetical protein